MWRKNLYSNVGYDDNYTDVSFLNQLRTNVNQKKIRLTDAVLLAGRVTEQLCVVFVFVVLYIFLLEEVYQPRTVFLYTTAMNIICYLYYVRQACINLRLMFGSHFRTVLIFLFLGFILSPVLKTLTHSISTDTIYATTFVMMIIHLVFFDYKVNVAIVSNALSTNAALFGSLCLASRLHTSQHAFVLLTIAAECFVLYPPFTYSVRKDVTVYFICFFVFSTTTLLAVTSVHMCIILILCILFINAVCPVLYVRWQTFKNNLYGPWDEAIISDKN